MPTIGPAPTNKEELAAYMAKYPLYEAMGGNVPSSARVREWKGFSKDGKKLVAVGGNSDENLCLLTPVIEGAEFTFDADGFAITYPDGHGFVYEYRPNDWHQYAGED